MKTSNHASPDTIPTGSLVVRELRGTIYMLVSILCFTGNTLLLRQLGGSMAVDPWLALLFRAVVGIAMTLVLVRSVGRVEWKPLFTDSALVWRGITGLLGTAFFYYSIPLLGAGLSLVIGNTYVLFGALLAVLVLNEPLGIRRSIWMLIAFFGMAVLMKSGPVIQGTNFGLGVGFALAAAIFSAITIVLVRKLTAQRTSATIFMAQCVYILMATAPIACLHFKWPGWNGIALLLIAALCAGFGQLAMNQGYRYLNVTRGASLQLALPVVASLGGYFFFDEALTVLQVLGAAVVVGGCWRVAAVK